MWWQYRTIHFKHATACRDTILYRNEFFSILFSCVKNIDGLEFKLFLNPGPVLTYTSQRIYQIKSIICKVLINGIVQNRIIKGIWSIISNLILYIEQYISIKCGLFFDIFYFTFVISS